MAPGGSPATYFPRDALFSTADRLLGCVQAALAETDAGAPERACVVPGVELLWDDCLCGATYVQTLRLYPSGQFPIIKQTGPFDRCAWPFTVVEFAITVLRCVPASDNAGRPPSCTKVTEAAIVDLEDRWAMQKGVRCCLQGSVHLLGEHLAVGEQGACAGSELHVFVPLSNCEQCDGPT